VLTDMNLKEMIEFHASNRAICTLAMSTAVPIEYGVGRVQSDGRVTYFEEKPVLKEYPVSMGIDIVEREILDYCAPNTDIAQHVIPRLLKEQKPVYAYLTDRRHYDIGTFKSLEEARQLLDQKKTLLQTS
jgi:NDP-sugar pyrophosphorylase family protein